MPDVLQQELNDGVLLLTLNRPEKKNALNIALWEAIYTAIAAAGDNDEVAVVVLTGAGGNFSSGVDLNDFANVDGEHPFENVHV